MEARREMSTATAGRKIATHLLTLAAGMGLAWVISRQHDGNDVAAAHAEDEGEPPRQVAAADTARGTRGVAFSGGGSHRQAWEMLLKRPRGERERYLPELLEEWIQRDPVAALEAVLEMENYRELLSHFHGLFQQDPAGFRHLFAEENSG